MVGTNRSFARKLFHAAVLLAFAGSAGAVTITSVDDLFFASSGQSLWEPGTDAVAVASFDEDLINTGPIPLGIGEISNVSNPDRPPYDIAFSACKGLGFSSTQCRNGASIGGLGSRPTQIVARIAYDIAFAACRLAFSSTVCRDGLSTGGLGARPPATVESGVLLSGEAALRFGFKGQVDVDSGSVDTDYTTQATLEVYGIESINAGDVFTIKTSEMPIDASLATEFSDINASFSAFADISAKLDLEAHIPVPILADLGGTVNLLDFDTGLVELELLGAKIGDGGIEVRILESPTFISLAEGVGTNIPFPTPIPGVSLPLGDVQVFIPELDTPPNTTGFDGTKVENTQLPVVRSVTDPLVVLGGGSGEDRTDFAKIDVDVDFYSLFAGAVLGASGGIPLVANVEVNLLDADAGAFFGIGENLTYEPQLLVDFDFNVPTLVETSPGMFEELPYITIPVGEDLNVIHPGGELIINPTYILNGLFTNLTDILLSPVFTLSLFELKLSGAAFSTLGLAGDLALFQQTFPLGSPIPIANLSDTQFLLGGYLPIPGGGLRIEALASAAVPEPTTLALMALGLAGLGFSKRNREA